MIKKFSFLVFFCLLTNQAFANDCVILLHGLAKSDRDMKRLEKALNSEGYMVVNHDYQSRSAPIQKLAIDVVNSAIKKCPDVDKKTNKETKKVHFVTRDFSSLLFE